MKDLQLFDEQNGLSADSNPCEIKAYFEKILELTRQDEEFPVDLDEVYPLVYGRKEEATRALRSEFIEGVDFQVLRKNAENPQGGRPEMMYKLSVPCLEYFIARKVRTVFEVYRQVFHKAVNPVKGIDLSDAQTVLRIAQNYADEQKQRMIAEQERDEYRKELTEAAPKIEAYDNMLNSKNTLLTNQIAKEFGMSDKTLNAILHDLKIQYRQRGQWLLYADYQGKGYTSEVTRSGKSEATGREWSAMQTVWLQKGRVFIHETIRPLLNSGRLVFKDGRWILDGKTVKVNR